MRSLLVGVACFLAGYGLAALDARLHDDAHETTPNVVPLTPREAMRLGDFGRTTTTATIPPFRYDVWYDRDTDEAGA